ncbi:collagen alpha-6(VI) chain-like [Pantherophis guttatus]|uniref:Collagen alpha-6(VI) chain-like n=1 Tax=Pantherophis guttatus TaxID=94885 RepID=A0ABM3YUD2_PANGU|nr:collagen alpha-6(VI) chain-like [Pantherophis guttatus]
MLLDHLALLEDMLFTIGTRRRRQLLAKPTLTLQTAVEEAQAAESLNRSTEEIQKLGSPLAARSGKTIHRLDPKVAAIRMKPRRVLFALKPKVDEQLDKLIQQGVLEPVDHAKQETPIVTPVKPDGFVRISADYKFPRPIDIIFLVSSSNTSFLHIKTFISTAVKFLPFGPNEYRIALAQYSDQVYSEFQLDTYKEKNPMLNHIKKKMVLRTGLLKTGSALYRIHEIDYWKPILGEERSKILIVITSQQSKDDIKEAGWLLQKAGVKIISIGVEKASIDELRLLATQPFYFFFPRIEDLSLFAQNISRIVVEAIHIGNTDINLLNMAAVNMYYKTVIEACHSDGVADLVFIVDSGSSQTNFEKMQLFLENLVSSLDVKEKCIRIGLVTFSTKPQVISSLQMTTDGIRVLQYIQGLSPKPGKANIGTAINFTRQKVFSASSGSRKAQGVEQIALLISHRPSEEDVRDAAKSLRRAGVTVFAIGIKEANITQLTQIVAYPPPRYVTQLSTFSQLLNKSLDFQKKIMTRIQEKLYMDTKRMELLKRGCVDMEEADIYFLIDGSSNLDYFDFMDLKLFLKEVIRLFTIGPNKVRIGVVQYAETSEVEFDLEEYGKINDILKAIDNIRQIGGTPPHTGAALTIIQSLFRKLQSQHSRTVPCHLIVLLDQISKDHVEEPAKRLRNEKINLYAIGVRHTNASQIYTIADSNNRAYFVNDFASLKYIKNDVVREICATEVCKEKKTDIVFLVDSSRSSGTEDFEKMKNFMRLLVDKSDVGPETVHIGVVQFSDKCQEEFQLNQHFTKSDINNAIGRMSLMGESTLTGDALQFVSNYFKPAKGARLYVKKVLILITNGEAQDEVKNHAEALREENIIIYSVGLFQANKMQLMEISGKPERVYYVEDFEVLKYFKNEIVFEICSSSDECRKIERLDIVFVIDGSGSIDPKEYDIMKDFMITLVKKSDVGYDRVQFGAVKYSAEPEIFFYLNQFNTKLAIIEAIQNDKPIGETTYTAKALHHSESLFSKKHGSRKHQNIPQVIIVITDGDSHDSADLEKVSKNLRARGIVIYAIGIERAKPDELLIMAGSEDRYFYVNRFEGLKNLYPRLSDNICGVSKPECGIPADLVFLIDGSNSISDSDFTKMKNFLQDVIHPFDTTHNVQIGIAQYSDRYQEEFSLNIFPRKSELENQIRHIRQMEGLQTYIGAALKKVKLYFTPEGGSRINEKIQQILLVITDGRSHDRVVQAAEDLRKKGVDINAIGVGRIDHLQLSQIAGSSDRKYTVDNFSELKIIKKRLVDDICEQEDKTSCFMDIVVGIEVSSQNQGDHVFLGQPQLEFYLPQIISALTSLTSLSCNAGSQTQTSVALKIKNTDPSVASKFQIDSEKLINSLVGTTITNASHLTAEFLDSLWETFQIKSANRRKVLLIFSDGLDDRIETLKDKSEELKKKGLDALITVVLEGASNFNDLQFIEFGKGYGYKIQLNIGMRDIASQLFKYMSNIAERTCCCMYCKCIGEEGEPGEQGRYGMEGPQGFEGSPGHLGDEGAPGPRGLSGSDGDKGYSGCRGNRGPKGQRGIIGEKGSNGEKGFDGINGELGSPGLPGFKGEKGDPGNQGSPGVKGIHGECGKNGFQGDLGTPGINNNTAGPKGFKGRNGRQGERGPLGPTGDPGSKGTKGYQGKRGHQGFQGRNGAQGPRGFPGDQGFKGPQGEKGLQGVKGMKGNPGREGFPSVPGRMGPVGVPGKSGARGNKGEFGDAGMKGERGLPGLGGLRGDSGAIGYGKLGNKGIKGQKGFPGNVGQEGDVGNPGIPGEIGLRGMQGQKGPAGATGQKGALGKHGPLGRRGNKGFKGMASFSPCELIAYIRKHSSCYQGTAKCPAYATELVFALDISQDTTLQMFEQMKKIITETVNQTNIRENNCPVGARVAVVSYSSNTNYLIRFIDFQNKKKLLQELNRLSLQRTTNRRDIGGSMRFVARHLFKRTLQSANVRKVAVFFSNGESDHPSSVNTALLEYSALEIVPVILAFNNVPEINRAFLMDDSGQFQVITIPTGGDYSPFLKRFQLCTLCYDKCKPDAACERNRRTRPPWEYVDAAFILDSSSKINPDEFEKLKEFLSRALNHFDISSQPATSSVGDRIALVSHAVPALKPQTQVIPVKKEFDLVTFNTTQLMKKYIQEYVQQLDGQTAVGHAIQWTINHIFSHTPNPRKYKVIIIISVGGTSQWDKAMLKKVSLRAKCQGYAFLVVSVGQNYNSTELQELASYPLEQHVIQLGRIHKPELNYAIMFLKPFLYFLHNGFNSYPPSELRTKCHKMSTKKSRHVLKHHSHK